MQVLCMTHLSGSKARRCLLAAACITQSTAVHQLKIDLAPRLQVLQQGAALGVRCNQPLGDAGDALRPPQRRHPRCAAALCPATCGCLGSGKHRPTRSGRGPSTSEAPIELSHNSPLPVAFGLASRLWAGHAVTGRRTLGAACACAEPRLHRAGYSVLACCACCASPACGIHPHILQIPLYLLQATRC